MKKFILLIILCSCEQKPIRVEVTYYNGDRETYETRVYLGCNAETRLVAGCTDCLTESRCNVRSVKILNP